MPLAMCKTTAGKRKDGIDPGVSKTEKAPALEVVYLTRTIEFCDIRAFWSLGFLDLIAIAS